MAGVGIGRFFGRTVSEGAAYALGVATGPVMAPAVEKLRQEAWVVYADRLPEALTLAAGVATGRIDEATAKEWSRKHGYDEAVFEKLVLLDQTGPELEPLLTMHRRGELTEPALRKGLELLSIHPDWWENFATLSHERLTPADVANAVQQGFMAGDGLLPTDAGGSRPFTPPVEVIDIDPVVEAETHGIDRERLRILAELSGNPPGPMELLNLWNRGAITETAVERGIREGRTKTKWTSAIKELRHHLLTPADAAGLRLRGWIDAGESYRLGAMSGASPEVMDRLFLNRGRPATTHQVWIGLQRGGKLEGPPISERETFKKAVVQSDIRPEYEPLLWAQRYTYPSAFVLRGLANAGDLTQAQTETILLYEGWEPTLAKQVSARWATGTASKQKEETRAELADEYQGGYITEAEYRTALEGLGYAGAALELEVHLADARRVKKYREKAIAAIEKAYLKNHLTDETALVRLGQAGVTGEAATLLLPFWQLEKEVAAKELTVSQIRAAYRKGTLTIEQATAELVSRGYLAADASLYLAE